MNWKRIVCFFIRHKFTPATFHDIIYGWECVRCHQKFSLGNEPLIPDKIFRTALKVPPSVFYRYLEKLENLNNECLKDHNLAGAQDGSRSQSHPTKVDSLEETNPEPK
jgi:hypothetical protein